MKLTPGLASGISGIIRHQEGAKIAEPLETALTARPNDVQLPPQNPVQMDLFEGDNGSTKR